MHCILMKELFLSTALVFKKKKTNTAVIATLMLVVCYGVSALMHKNMQLNEYKALFHTK